MKTWQHILRDSITTYDDLKKHLGCENSRIQEVIKTYPMKINPYFLGLIECAGDPIWLQAVPDVRECEDSICLVDPLGEEALSPAPHLVHKYPDRVLLLVSGTCAMYCRFCTRKRKVGTLEMVIADDQLEDAFNYIENNCNIKEVLLSGGDPLLLEDEQLERILSRLHAIDHIDLIRIGTRVPSTLPMRVTPDLVALLKRYHPLYINTHFNHPRELTAQAKSACTALADNGIPVGCQTVLLKGVNDSASTLTSLFRGLLKVRVKPYYLFQADLTRGTNHLRTSSRVGISLMRSLYGHLSGMAIPRFALDAPGGKGKIPLSPQYVLEHGENLVFENYLGEICTYPEIIDI